MMNTVAMKTASRWLVLFLCMQVTAATYAGSVSMFSGPATSTAIPDDLDTGVAFNFNFSDPSLISVSLVTVSLDISGGWNGDLYAYLSHNGGFAVLLNRTGRTAVNIAGSSDSGFNVTLSDNAANGDIHLASAGGGVLSGLWQPDGRNVDPADSLDATPRTALLSSFNGKNPNGQWNLFLADTSPLGTSTLKHYSVNITAVPEPSSLALEALGATLLAVFFYRKRGRERIG